MPIRFGRTSALLSLLLVSAACGIAQDALPPPAATPKPALPAEASEASGKPGTAPSPPASSETGTALDYLFNRKPQDGSAGQHALDAGKRSESKAIAEEAVGIPRPADEAAHARFERYLGMAEVPQAALDAYLTKTKAVSRDLRENRVFEAWKRLHDLADETLIDGGISRELANRIEAIWNTGRATVNIDKRNEQLRKDVKTANANADLMSESIMDREVEQQRRMNRENRKAAAQSPAAPNGGVPQVPPEAGTAPSQSIAGLEGKLQLTEEYLRSLELKTKIKLNELKQEKLLEGAKADFAEYITTLFQSGRLSHVVLAADFYRKVFQEGEYPAAMAKQVNAALEIHREVQAAVDVFRYKVERNQLAGASDSLEKAFLASELNPAILGLERPLKEKVADFHSRLEQMRNLIEARDFGNLEALLAELKTSAVDFDTTKPNAMVNAIKLESKMRLGKAKLAAQQGDLKLALEEFQSAAQAWPGNPDLEDKALTFFNTQDVKSQSLTEFDRLVADQNFRAIFDGQLGYAPAIRGDAAREDALKKALTAVKDAEIASEKAGVLMMNGDYSGAWEAIELASAQLPDDKKLNRMRADLSGRCAEFVSAVNKARDAESRNESGYSLTWYVNAQRRYPASRIANEGIDRVSKKVLTAGSATPQDG